MQSLFLWQLLGDFFKVMALVLGYQLLAKKMLWHYLVIEMLSIAFLYFSSLFLIEEYGYMGASIAHFFNCILLFCVLLLVFKKALFDIT